MRVQAKSGRGRCPTCGWQGKLPGFGPRRPDGAGEKASSVREPALPVLPPTRETYGVTSSVEIRCPCCQKTLPPDARHCPACGLDLKKGTKPRRVFERVERSWEAGLSFRRRLLIFILCQAVVIPVGLTGAILGDRVGAFISSWIPFTLLLLFIVGTYSRVDLVRKKNGRSSLSKTWRLGLVELPPTRYRLGEFEGVSVGMANDTNVTDWILFCFLVPMGIIPAILFWYHVIRKNTFYVALTRDHGYPAETLYRGTNEALAREIADALHDLSGLQRS
jgi:hypothetical protein